MKHHPANANGVYDLSTMKAPQLSGFLLKLFTWLAEMFPSLAKFTGKDTGIYTLRRLETKEPPTYYPFCPQSYLEACKKQKGMSIEDAIKILGSINTKRAFPCSIDYHLAYLSLKITPAQVCKVLIETLEADLTQSVPLCPMNKFDQADILKQAEASAKRYADKQPLGPLDGVPIAIKDEMDALPYKTDVGTSFLGHLPTRDAVVVERLRKAGAIIIGKTNMHEFGLDVTGCNPHGGTSRNPYNINRFPGGSSSGSAVAVAAGFCPIAIGAG